ncbi:MAG TPA: FAD-dependent oxidoreductase, partial [Devosia sp.]|nr:FAD-dependent oxidoreductase [Devosia sp.]
MATLLTPDLCVIGAGASGVAVAEAARRLGASVVVVEKAATGGMSLRAGNLALRALGVAGEKAAAVGSGAALGVTADAARVSFRRLRDHIAEIIGQAAAETGAPRLQALGIELVRGTGTFADPRTLKTGDTEIRARRFVIATGARSSVPDLPGLHTVAYFTPETIFDNTRKLSHLVVIGAGPMGLELALGYRRLGCEVTVVEPARALPQSDPELADIALRRLRDEGVVLHEGSAIVAVQARSQGIGVTIRVGDEVTALDASHILVASNRIANLDELGLDAAHIRRSKSDTGALWLNGALRTTNPRIFAVGEAAGHAPAAHLGALEADLVVRAALLGRPAHYDAAAVPRLTLTDPPIAEIGLSEPMARTRLKGGFTVLRAGYAQTDEARAGRDGMGVAKLVVGRSGHILGAGIVGAGAAELAALFAFAMDQRIEVARLAELAAPYPSHAELARILGEQALAGTG